jgi:hypothetical protein
MTQKAGANRKEEPARMRRKAKKRIGRRWK